MKDKIYLNDVVDRMEAMSPKETHELLMVTSEEKLAETLDSIITTIKDVINTSPGDRVGGIQIASALLSRLSAEGAPAHEVALAMLMLRAVLSLHSAPPQPPQPKLIAGYCHSCANRVYDTLGYAHCLDEFELEKLLTRQGKADLKDEMGHTIPCPLWTPRVPEWCEKHQTWYDPDLGCQLCRREFLEGDDSEVSAGTEENQLDVEP